MSVNRRARLVLAAIVVVAGVGVAAARFVRDASPDVETGKVLREDFRVTVEATGTLEAAVAYEIGPPSARDFWEYNLTWMIPEGTRVEKGQVIARFDTTQLDDSLRQHRADLEKTLQEKEKEERNLEVKLRQLSLDLVRAKGELKTMDVEMAVPEELISSIELAQLRLRRKLAEQRVSFLTEKIEFEKALVTSKLELLDVKRAFSQEKISYYEETKKKFDVVSPVSGLVMYIPKRNGDRWEVGEGVWMMAKILKVADTSTLRVESSVLEVDSARVQVGQKAEISVDALPSTAFSSEVVEIGRIVHERSVQDPSKVFDAYLPIKQVRMEGLRPGMGVQVVIETRHLPGRLTIPLEAVRVSPEGTFVELLDTSGRPRERQVKLGDRNRKRVVVDEGLEEGQTVALRSVITRS